MRARDGLLQAQQSYQQSLDEFKIVLSLPTDVPLELDLEELKSLEGKGMENPEFSVEEAVEAALDLRLDLANSRDPVDVGYKEPLTLHKLYKNGSHPKKLVKNE